MDARVRHIIEHRFVRRSGQGAGLAEVARFHVASLVIASGAKQSMDCSVAGAPRNDGGAMDSLVSTDWLADHLGEADLVVVDASWFMPSSGRSGGKEYLAAHIPGARFLDIDEVADKAHSAERPAICRGDGEARRRQRRPDRRLRQ